MKQHQTALAIAAIVVSMIALAWITLPRPGEDTLSRHERGGPIRVGYALEPPFVTMAPDGEIRGTEPELLRLALSRLGHERVQWVHGYFENLIHELNSGRIDIICAGMFITDARAAQVAFTRPTLRVPTALLIPARAGTRWSSLADIAADGSARLAALAGSIEASAAVDAGIPATRIRTYPDVASATAALRNEEVDSLALSALSLRHVLAAQGMDGMRLVVSSANGGAGEGTPAFAVRRDDRRLLSALDEALAGIVGGPDHAALVAPYGVPTSFLPPQGVGAQ